MAGDSFIDSFPVYDYVQTQYIFKIVAAGFTSQKYENSQEELNFWVQMDANDQSELRYF